MSGFEAIFFIGGTLTALLVLFFVFFGSKTDFQQAMANAVYLGWNWDGWKAKQKLVWWVLLSLVAGWMLRNWALETAPPPKRPPASVAP